MENRIIKTEDGFTFVNVTDLALALWATNSVPLFELNDELNEALITSEEELKEVLELGYIGVMEGGHEEVINHEKSYGVFCMTDRMLAMGYKVDGLDIFWSDAIIEYTKFLGSKFNVDTKSELECIDEYFNNK
jgi:hypothetical protein